MMGSDKGNLLKWFLTGVIGIIFTYLIGIIGEELLEQYSTGFYYFLGQLLATIGLIRKWTGQIKFQLLTSTILSTWKPLPLILKILFITTFSWSTLILIRIILFNKKYII